MSPRANAVPVVANRLLNCLPRLERQRLTAACEEVDLVESGVLCEPGDRIRHVYFPICGHPLQGGFGENAFAPNLAGDVRAGLGAWSVNEVVEYLKTGSNDKTAAAGPMAEVVKGSTQHLNDDDLTAIATYLKGAPPSSSNAETQEANSSSMTLGAQIYVDNCSGCHMAGGEGMPQVFPPLKSSSSVQAREPDTLVQVVLGGATTPATTTKPTGLKMPAFQDKLADAQVAAVVSYIRTAWGNGASTVSENKVAKIRRQMKSKP